MCQSSLSQIIFFYLFETFRRNHITCFASQQIELHNNAVWAKPDLCGLPELTYTWSCSTIKHVHIHYRGQPSSFTCSSAFWIFDFKLHPGPAQSCGICPSAMNIYDIWETLWRSDGHYTPQKSNYLERQITRLFISPPPLFSSCRLLPQQGRDLTWHTVVNDKTVSHMRREKTGGRADGEQELLRGFRYTDRWEREEKYTREIWDIQSRVCSCIYSI